MKYNLSMIMHRAWTIKKENPLNIFSLCLKMAWSEFKGNRVIDNTFENRAEAEKTADTTLPVQDKLVAVKFNITKGSEKQIAWARSLLLKVCNKAVDMASSYVYAGKFKTEEEIPMVVGTVARLEKMTDASKIIDLYKNRF